MLVVVLLYTITLGLSAQPAVAPRSLQMLDVYVVPHNLTFQNTTVGGLSGIDYDEKNGVYYLISDDRSYFNPARYYTARIVLKKDRIDSVVFTGVTTLLQKSGAPYPGTKEDPRHTPDPEAMRYDPVHRTLVWSSEGERIVKQTDTVLEDPSINVMRLDGSYIDTFSLPPNLRMHSSEKGPRRNGVLEGMSFADEYKHLYVNIEEPRYEDGPRADLTPNGAWVRFYKFDVATRKNLAQYAYLLDPVAYPSIPADTFKINGIPDILSVGNNRFIVLERSYSIGRLSCTIKLFLADLNGATDIRNNPSLIRQPAARPVSKKLLLNMDTLPVYVDNVEGMTLGPRLPNGHQSLILVADNNFDARGQTQFFLFEIIP